MKRSFALIATLAAALLIALGSEGRALETSAIGMDGEGALKVTASPTLIDFGAANKGSQSQVVLLTLTNDEPSDITVLALQSSDAQLKVVSAVPASSLTMGGEVVPTQLSPGGQLVLGLRYFNADREGPIIGQLTVLTLGAGSEPALIGFTVTAAGTPPESETLTKPGADFFFGSCFLDSLAR